MIASILSFLGGWRGYVAAGLAGALLASGATWRVLAWRDAAHQLQQAQQTVRLITHEGQISLKVALQFDQVRLVDVDNTRTLEEEILHHVTPKDDSACDIGLGFVRLFNAAAHGSVPAAAAGADDTPSGVALSDIAKATVENDGQYDLVSHQLEALQDWVRQQQAARP